MFFVHPQISPVKFAARLFNGVKLNNRLQEMFPGKQLIFTDMGRSAFKIIVEKLNLQNSEIMMPSYICDIFLPILEKYNIKPIFLDIDLKTFHIKIEDIVKKITQNTKAIIVCHTYGLQFDINKIKKYGLPIIEDCAHAFGSNAGMLGDVSFFSIYKQFPALRGGLLVCPKDWKISLPRTAFNFRDFISLLNCFSLFAFIFKKIGVGLGKEMAEKMIRREKSPEPSGLNSLSLKLFSYSLDDFERSLPGRIKLAEFFQSELQELGFDVQEPENNVFCYLSALVPKNLEAKRDEIVEKLRKYGVFCVRIWHKPIILDKNEFPNAFSAAKRIINFPLQNYYTKKDIIKIISAVRAVLEKI